MAAPKIELKLTVNLYDDGQVMFTVPGAGGFAPVLEAWLRKHKKTGLQIDFVGQPHAMRTFAQSVAFSPAAEGPTVFRFAQVASSAN